VEALARCLPGAFEVGALIAVVARWTGVRDLTDISPEGPFRTALSDRFFEAWASEPERL